MWEKMVQVLYLHCTGMTIYSFFFVNLPDTISSCFPTEKSLTEKKKNDIRYQKQIITTYKLQCNCISCIISTTAVSQGKPVSILIITCDWSAITPGTFSYGTEFRCPLEDLM